MHFNNLYQKGLVGSWMKSSEHQLLMAYSNTSILCFWWWGIFCFMINWHLHFQLNSHCKLNYSWAKLGKLQLIWINVDRTIWFLASHIKVWCIRSLRCVLLLFVQRYGVLVNFVSFSIKKSFIIVNWISSLIQTRQLFWQFLSF